MTYKRISQVSEVYVPVPIVQMCSRPNVAEQLCEKKLLKVPTNYTVTVSDEAWIPTLHVPGWPL